MKFEMKNKKSVILYIVIFSIVCRNGTTIGNWLSS